jgi:hypothetical protein
LGALILWRVFRNHSMMRAIGPVFCFCICSAYSQQAGKDSLATLLLARNPAHLHRVSAARANANPKMQDKKVGGYYEKPVEEWAGVTEPLGFFDPGNWMRSKSEGTQRFYREVELKHGRLSMLAALGFLVGEQYHPLFGGDIDVPSLVAFQKTLTEFPQVEVKLIYIAIITAIAIPEIYSTFNFEEPSGKKSKDGEFTAEEWQSKAWQIRKEIVPGDLGFDPLGLKPTDAEEMKAMQTKELNNGRLAMFGIAGMVAQELVTGQKLF